MLRALMEIGDNMQEQIKKISTEMEILKKNQKEILEIKNSITKMNACDALFSRKSVAKESLLEHMSTGTSKTEKQRKKNDWKEKKKKTCNRLSKNCGKLQKVKQT